MELIGQTPPPDLAQPRMVGLRSPDLQKLTQDFLHSFTRHGGCAQSSLRNLTKSCTTEARVITQVMHQPSSETRTVIQFSMRADVDSSLDYSRSMGYISSRTYLGGIIINRSNSVGHLRQAADPTHRLRDKYRISDLYHRSISAISLHIPAFDSACARLIDRESS